MVPKLLIPKLSIIIPTYKRYDVLSACVQSVLIQNGNYEIIVVSDGFDKKTDSIMQNIRARYKNKSGKIIYLKQRNQGPAAARNKGLNHAKGEIITFLDDDCVVSEQWIGNIISAHKQHPKVLAIAGSIVPYNANLISEFSQSLEARAVVKNTSYFYPSLINNSSYKREVFGTVGEFNQTFRYASGEDVEFNYRLDLHGIKTMFVKNINIKHMYQTKLLQFLNQQFCFGKERLRLMCIANDYPFDKSNNFLYIFKRVITPLADPWLRLLCAFKLHRKHKLLYLFLGYFQQMAYWLGFLYTFFRSPFMV